MIEKFRMRLCKILAHVPKNRFIIVAASEVVKEFARRYNPRATQHCTRAEHSCRSIISIRADIHDHVSQDSTRRMGPCVPLASVHPDAGMGTGCSVDYRTGQGALSDRYGG